MPTVALTGNDTILLGGIVLTDLADGDVADLTFPNELMKVKTGKNGNSIFAFDNTGRQVDFKVRVLRGSPDDQVINSWMQQLKYDPPSFVLLDAEITKRIGDGNGGISYDSYTLGGGTPTKQTPMKSNADGDEEQAVVVYEFKFTNSDRFIR